MPCKRLQVPRHCICLKSVLQGTTLPPHTGRVSRAWEITGCKHGCHCEFMIYSLPRTPVSPINHPPISHHFAGACPAPTSHLREIDALASYFIGEKKCHQAWTWWQPHPICCTRTSNLETILPLTLSCSRPIHPLVFSIPLLSIVGTSLYTINITLSPSLMAPSHENRGMCQSTGDI